MVGGGEEGRGPFGGNGNGGNVFIGHSWYLRENGAGDGVLEGRPGLTGTGTGRGLRYFQFELNG